MRHLKKFNESMGNDTYQNKVKRDLETTNRQMVTQDWLESHPFPGVTKVVTPSVGNSNPSIDIYFGRDSYISIFAPETKEYSKSGETGTVRRRSSIESIEWRMRGSDKDYILDNKEEFISWVDKLLIKFGMNRSVLKDLDRTIEENRRIHIP